MRLEGECRAAGGRLASVPADKAHCMVRRVALATLLTVTATVRAAPTQAFLNSEIPHVGTASDMVPPAHLRSRWTDALLTFTPHAHAVASPGCACRQHVRWHL